MEIQARYLHIKWNKKREIVSIKENYLPEKIEFINDKEYELQLYTYPKIDGLPFQIAFQVDDENIIPAILSSDGSKKKMKLIVDTDTNKQWWIENGKWIKDKLYFQSNFCNHIGDSQISFGDTILNINVKTISLTEEDKNKIIDTFKDGLWKLIASKDSYSNVDVSSEKTDIITDEYINLLNQYLKDMEDILKKPKSLLKEYFTKESIKRLKPINKTFMEYISDSTKQYYTSKSKLEYYNIPDNQYVYYTLNQVMYILNNNIGTQQYISSSYKHRIDEYKKTLADIDHTLKNKTIKVDELSYIRNIENLKDERDELYKGQQSENDKRESKNFIIDITKIGSYNGEKFFEANIKDDKNTYKSYKYRFYDDNLGKILQNHYTGEYKVICENISLYKD